MLILLIGIGWIYVSSNPEHKLSETLIEAPQHSFLSPEIFLQNVDGKFVSLSDHQGKVVLINFWATWCPPCRAEIAAMQKVFEDYQDQGFTILAINSTSQDQNTAVMNFIKTNGVTFPILLDSRGEATNTYRIKALPTSYFVDRQGIISEIIIGGPMPEVLLRQHIEELLQEE